jgi:hypothetical protein
MNSPRKPLPRVSAKHYAAAAAAQQEEPQEAAAKVRFRLKGAADGPIYQGQNIHTPCATCGGGANKVTITS